MKQLRNKSTKYISLLLSIALICSLVCGCQNSLENASNSTGNFIFHTPGSSASPAPNAQDPVWYEQSMIPDVQEIEYTPPAGVKFPYYIKVNRAMCCVTVYGIDNSGNYSIPVKAFACSVGKDNPNTEEIEQTILGEYQMPQNLGKWWCRMVDDTYGQFAYRINGGYMFHSVPCYEMKKDSLETEEFNKLGESASLGCVRLTVRDAKWICDNCPEGTTTLIYDDTSTPGPLGKPDTIKLPIGHEWSGWDPTDPDKNNPWLTSSARIEAENITTKIGVPVDVFKNVKAYDTCGNDITSKMTWYGKYTFDVAGTYYVTFKVTDAIGSKAEKQIKITITDPDNPNTNVNNIVTSTVPSDLANRITSEFAILINKTTGETLFSKNSSTIMRPASITKAVALLVMLENIKDFNKTYVITQETYDYVIAQDASITEFPIGEPISTMDLIYGSFMLSGADATVTLANAIAGNEENFVKLMNQKADAIGMINTNFANSTGLPHDEHYSTCDDLAIFFKEALKNEQFRAIFTTKEYTTKSIEKYPNGRVIKSTMFNFLKNNQPQNNINIIGGKTGFTNAAGLCLASLAVSDNNNIEYVLITGKAPGHYWDTEIPNHAKDALTAYGSITETVK